MIRKRHKAFEAIIKDLKEFCAGSVNSFTVSIREKDRSLGFLSFCDSSLFEFPASCVQLLDSFDHVIYDGVVHHFVLFGRRLCGVPRLRRVGQLREVPLDAALW